MLLCLFNQLDDFIFRHQKREILRNLALVNITIAVKSSASVPPFTLLSFNRELTMWISLGIVDGDIDRDHLLDLLNDRSNVIDYDISIFITLKQEKLASILIVMSVNRSDRHFFLDAHIIELGHELPVVSVRFERRGWTHDPDSDCAN